MTRKNAHKVTLLTLAAIAVMVFTSCGTKNCRCYEKVGGRWTGPRTTATMAGTVCSSLNERTLICNEMDDPILNPDDIAVDEKTKK